MLPEDVADARAVPAAERAPRGRRDSFVRVSHHDVGVVLDPCPGSQRTDQEVDLLARGPLRLGAESELLVESAHPGYEGRAQEDRERDRPVPEILPRQHRGGPRPGRR